MFSPMCDFKSSVVNINRLSLCSNTLLLKMKKKKKSKGLSPDRVQKQKIISTLLKSGMSDEEIAEAFKKYTIERKIVYENGRKIKKVIMLPKTGVKGDEVIRVCL